MTHEQYSRFQRYLGILEGFGMGLPKEVNTDVYWQTFENLDTLAEELKPEVDK